MSEEENQQQEQDKTPGVVSWNEYVARDATSAGKFYSELLGWEARDIDMGDMTYTMFHVGERPVSGMVTLPDELKEQVPSHWLSYVTVQDLDAAVEKATGLGAKVCKEITSLPMGRFAIITDPLGAVIGLWEFAENPPPCD